MSLRYQGGFLTESYFPLKVPNAPTIGTATAGTGSASVTFTAPSDVGGGSITSYIAVAKNSSTGAVVTATGSSSPISVTGLTGGQTYTVTVAATNAYGTGPASTASNSVVAVPNIGDAFGGGFYAGKISTAGTGVADYYLIVSPKATGEASGKAFRTGSAASDPTSVINGPANSATMNDATHPAAQFCEGLSIGGYTDWYLPAKNELEVCYYFLKPTTSNNATAFGGAGSNANAVSPEPISTVYTTSAPPQTSATAFQVGNSEAFASQIFWTSTEAAAGNPYAWMQYFAAGAQDSGFQNTATKTDTYYVRAVRRMSV